MIERRNIFRTKREDLTKSSVDAVVRLTRSSFHGSDDKLIEQFT